jgi:hypothetical protein
MMTTESISQNFLLLLKKNRRIQGPTLHLSHESSYVDGYGSKIFSTE